MIRYYRLIGKLPVPCGDLLEWAWWFENADRTIARTRVGPIEVSTVFLGLDHGFRGRVQLFETMCFGAQDKMVKIGKRARLMRSDLNYQDRYETWDEAEKGHQRAIEWAKAELTKIDTAMKVTNADIPKSD
jgi:hypothetical protein